MESIKRKRVTRVGSGAFSIYLPKKWIDSWPEAQQESREVDLHLINDALLISPAHVDHRAMMSVPDEQGLVCQRLQSAYVRGIDRLELTPTDGDFGAETIASARDLLRHLDERLSVTSTPAAIGFSLDPNLPPNVTSGADLLRILTAKVRDMVDLCAEAVDTHLVDPDRSIHAMTLMRTTQQEDVRRLLHQALRMVARIELPMRSISDFQLLDLLAADLERFGSHLVRIAEILLSDLRLDLNDLDYPRSHVLKQIGTLPVRPPLVQELIRNYRDGFAAIATALAAAMDAVQDRDMDTLSRLQTTIMEQQDAMADRFFATITEHWGEDMDAKQAMGVFAMARVASILADLAHVLRSTCHHALILLAAEPEEANS